MNKGELVARIAETTKMTKKESEVMVNAFMDAVKEAMKKGDKVALVGFGTFGVKERKLARASIPRPSRPSPSRRRRPRSSSPARPSRTLSPRSSCTAC